GKEPRVEQGAAANRDAGAARRPQHSLRVGDTADVTVADDGNALDRLHHGANAVQADRAAKALRPRASVNDDGRNTRLLERAGEVRGAPARLVPAEAHLDGHRDA